MSQVHDVRSQSDGREVLDNGPSCDEMSRDGGRIVGHGTVGRGRDVVASPDPHCGVEWSRAAVIERCVLLDTRGAGDGPAVHDEDPVLAGHVDPRADKEGVGLAVETDHRPVECLVETVFDGAVIRVEFDASNTQFVAGDLDHCCDVTGGVQGKEMRDQVTRGRIGDFAVVHARRERAAGHAVRQCREHPFEVIDGVRSALLSSRERAGPVCEICP